MSARRRTDRRHGLVALLGFLAACFGVAAVGGAVTFPAVETWYRGLTKPAFNPPDWVFGPVWSVLYALMAVAGWRVWRRARPAEGRNALALFALQLALNLGWSILFFGLHAIGPALIEIVVLWITIAATLAAFWRIDRIAGGLLLPYAAWVGYAAVLNGAIWWLN